jgi:SAM-dependent MidA family methyltransferase
MRGGDLREVYVDERDGQILAREGPPSSPALAAYLRRAGVALEEGWRAEISLAAIEWVRDAARRLTRGFIVLVDYGHEARELYSMTHSGGTLTTFAQHAASGPESREAPPAWLAHPGERDITSHVDFTSVRRAAEEEGLTTLGFLDQTYFLMGLVAQAWSGRWSSHPAGDRFGAVSTRRHAQLKTLIMPGGLGSTMKVLILGKEVGTPSLLGCSYRMRVT